MTNVSGARFSWQAKHADAFAASSTRVRSGPTNSSNPQPPVDANRRLSLCITSVNFRGPSSVTPLSDFVSSRSNAITAPSANRPVR
jgi:hypothetical protein